MDNKNSLDFMKRAFAVSASAGNTVMECNQMEDYFHMSSLEMHQQLADYVEFAARCANADDLVGMEEVMRHINNLADVISRMRTNTNGLYIAMKAKVEAEREVKGAHNKIQQQVASLVGYMDAELGMTIDIK
jgi:hypothetical protein